MKIYLLTILLLSSLFGNDVIVTSVKKDKGYTYINYTYNTFNGYLKCNKLKGLYATSYNCEEFIDDRWVVLTYMGNELKQVVIQNIK